MTWITRPRSELARGVAAWQMGAGIPLVLLHGVGLNADAWGGQADALAAHYRVIAVDLPGHGESKPLAGNPGLNDYTDRIVDAIQAIEAPVLLAGHSMGAMIALDLAIRYPDLCQSVAAVNAIFRRNPEAAAAVRARAAEISAKYPMDPSTTLQRWFPTSIGSTAAQACRDWLLDVDAAAYKQAYTVFASEDGPSKKSLTELQCPALFMTGTHDPNSTPAMSEAMARLAPRGEAMVINGAAHMMPMTHVDEVNRRLVEFYAAGLES